MNLLGLFSSDQFVRALGWTILHSVWQIAIVASLLLILLIFMKKSSSRIRYFTACVAMLLVVAISVTTFTVEYSNYQESIKVSQGFGLSPIELDFANAVIQESNEACRTTFFNGFENYFEQNIPLIVLIWNLVVLVLLLKTTSGFAYSQRIKSYQTNAMPTHWEAMLFQLTKKLGIKKRVGILESAIIKAPIVAGYFKPMILIPLGVVSGLSTEQVEAILAHELAHIKRNDYLANIFQSIIEVLFFYHPALWWISKNIRYERENACDDIALNANISRKALATALTNLEVLNHEKLSLALAFSSKKTSLLNRIKRILHPQKTKLTMKEGFIAVCIVLASFFIMSFGSSIIQNTSGLLGLISKIQEKKPTKYTVGGAFYKLVFDENNNPEKFYKNDIEIPSKDWGKYYAELKAGIELKNAEILSEQYFEKDERFPPPVIARRSYKTKLEGVDYKLVFDKNAELEKLFISKTEVPKEEWGNYESEISQAMTAIPSNNYGFWSMESSDWPYEYRISKSEMEHLNRKKQSLELQLKESKAKKNRIKSLQHSELETLENKIALFEMRLQHLEIELTSQKTQNESELQLKEQELDREWKVKQKEIHQYKMLVLSDLIEEMKKDGLIDKDALYYKVYFFEDNFKINDVKQSNKAFKKYKSLFYKKAKGKYKLEDMKFNNYPNKRETTLSNTSGLKQSMERNLAKKEQATDILRLLEIRKREIENRNGINDEEKQKKLKFLTQQTQIFLNEIFEANRSLVKLEEKYKKFDLQLQQLEN